MAEINVIEIEICKESTKSWSLKRKTKSIGLLSKLAKGKYIKMGGSKINKIRREKGGLYNKI